jgi:hypothetical protein
MHFAVLSPLGNFKWSMTGMCKAVQDLLHMKALGGLTKHKTKRASFKLTEYKVGGTHMFG